ncbi:transposase [Pseudomonas mendocina]|nr:transposase [Pseudomonas mendocina]MBH3340265.1 transposase [Pseudomonas mendocina]
MPAQSHRLRLGRHCQPGRPYLLTTTTYRRQPLFGDFDLARLLVAELRAASEEGWVTSLAWVVMPDHLHWLIELHGKPLDKLMRRIKSNSARHINRRRGHSGVLWQQGFHDRAIRREEDLLPVARYIIANPLRAGLVERIGDYPLWDACWL